MAPARHLLFGVFLGVFVVFAAANARATAPSSRAARRGSPEAAATAYRGAPSRRSLPPLPRPTSEPACVESSISLVVQSYAGRVTRAYVPIETDGVRALLLFDTGTSQTHLTHPLEGPAIVKGVGRVRIGCETRTLDSWRERPLDSVGGLPVVGSVGAEAVAGAPTELDLANGKLVRHARLPDAVHAWPFVPIEKKSGVLLTRARINGVPMQLLVDTGSEDAILMTREFDEAKGVATTDALGNTIHLLLTPGSFVWERPEPSTIRVMWTRSFPAFERQAASWGGGSGLLGLSSFGARRLVFDVPNGRLYVEPAPAGAPATVASSSGKQRARGRTVCVAAQTACPRA